MDDPVAEGQVAVSEERLPDGTVTFLFTDVEDSTPLLVRLGDRYNPLLEAHRSIIREAVARHGGHEIGTQGDGFTLAFGHPSAAIATAVEAQLALSAHPWPVDGEFRIRMGIHTGEVQLVGSDYVGLAVHQAQRVSSVAHGGQILVSSAVRVLAGTAPMVDTILRFVGRIRLKGLPDADDLFQVHHPGLASDFPPPRSIEVVPNNLPTFVSSFVGREAEVLRIRSALSRTRMLTLTGPGGTGKTRLAVHAARDVAEDYPDGVWIVDLTSVDGPADVERAVLATFSINHDDPGWPELTKRLAGSAVLLILDNCEHVAEDAARSAQRLIDLSEGVRVLATSREVLGLAGEVVEQVAPMEDGSALFLERARAQYADFEPDDAAAVMDICQLVDGLPLAIELAAAQVRTFSCTEIARRLREDRLGALGSGPRTASDRQRTMSAVIEWGYRLLAPHEQEILGRLAVFRGGFTLEAASDVCVGGGIELQDLPDLVASLVDRSLVTRTIRSNESRYGLLETIREYSWNRFIEADEPQSWVLRPDGRIWEVGPVSATVHVRDSKGLRHIAALVAAPGRDQHVLELQGAPRDLENASIEVLDDVARDSYRSRIKELEEELEDAEAMSDLARAERARAELDVVLAELRRATGVGGRPRMSPASAERARAAVTKAIRSSISTLWDDCPDLASHLSEHVKTGTYCRYDGDGQWLL